MNKDNYFIKNRNKMMGLLDVLQNQKDWEEYTEEVYNKPARAELARTLERLKNTSKS